MVIINLYSQENIMIRFTLLTATMASIALNLNEFLLPIACIYVVALVIVQD